jgi:hypothetical protein
MSNGKDMIQDWDVILESKVWDLRVGQRNVIPAWVGASNHELSLNERAGWVNMRSGHPPTTTEMLRLFTSLSGIFIRGGYYDGHEETWIDNVIMKEGDHKADALLRQVEKHARHPLLQRRPPPPSIPACFGARRRLQRTWLVRQLSRLQNRLMKKSKLALRRRSGRQC